jgi:transcriptional regulator with XRE-family HTH domain
MIDKFSSAIQSLRKSLVLTQVQFAKKLGIGLGSLTHYETGARRPDVATIARLARAAHDASRVDLAEIFVVAIPGVRDGLLVPTWRLPREQQPAPPDELPPNPPLDRFANKPRQIMVTVQHQHEAEINKSLIYQAQRRARRREITGPKTEKPPERKL